MGFIAISHEWFSLGTLMCSCTGLQEKEEERKGFCFPEALTFLVYHKAREGLAAHTTLRPRTLTAPASRELLIEPQNDLMPSMIFVTISFLARQLSGSGLIQLGGVGGAEVCGSTLVLAFGSPPQSRCAGSEPPLPPPR